MDIRQPSFRHETRCGAVPLGGVAKGFVGFGLHPSEAVQIRFYLVRSDCSVGSPSGSCKAGSYKAQTDWRDRPAIGPFSYAKGVAGRLLRYEGIREVPTSDNCREGPLIKTASNADRAPVLIAFKAIQVLHLKYLEAAKIECETPGVG
jgi:hypothetical protein